MAETKTKAFRADEKTIARINAWMERDGIGNGEALERMADIIDMSEAKGNLAGRSTEIANFESLTHQLTTAYTASLQLAQNAEARIREEFAKRLDSQENTIADLQARVKQMKDETAVAKAKADDAVKGRDALQSAYDEQAKDLEHQKELTAKAEEAEQKARAQADRLTALTGDQADEIRALKVTAAKSDQLQEQVKNLTDALSKEKDAAQRAAGRAEEKLANELEKAQTRQEAAVLKAEKDAQSVLIKVRDECQDAIAKAQKATSDVQAKAQKAIDAAQAQAVRYQKLYEDLLAESAHRTKAEKEEK